MFGFALVLAIGGIALVYAGFKGYDPRTVFTGVFTGQAPSKLAAVSGTGAASTPAAPVTGNTSGQCNDKVPLVERGGVKLQPPAMGAFLQAQARAGQRISLTGSWRSCAIQTAGYRLNPGRFADPASSMHPQGLAIDVRNPVPANVRAALLASGWFQSRPDDEPWHFSYGRAG
jgi:hypothetical protein